MHKLAMQKDSMFSLLLDLVTLDVNNLTSVQVKIKKMWKQGVSLKTQLTY